MTMMCKGVKADRKPFCLSPLRMMLFPDRPLSRGIYLSDLGVETVEGKKEMDSHLPET